MGVQRLAAVLVLVVGVAVLGLPAAYAAGKATEQAASGTDYVQVPAAPMTLRVVYPDGKTPVASAPVKVWSMKSQEFAWEGATDEEGRVTLGALEPNRYQLVVADRIAIPLVVSANASAVSEEVDVFVPHGRGQFAAMSDRQQSVVLAHLSGLQPALEGLEGSWGQAPAGGGLLTSPWLWGAVVPAAGVGAAVIIEDDQSGDGGTEIVSPSS